MKIYLAIVKSYAWECYERKIHPFLSREQAEERVGTESRHGYGFVSAIITEVNMFPQPHVAVKVSRRFPHPINELTALCPWRLHDTDGSMCTAFIEGWSFPQSLDDFQGADRLISLNLLTLELTDDYKNRREWDKKQVEEKRSRKQKWLAYWDPTSGTPKPEDAGVCPGYSRDVCKMHDLMGTRCARCDRAYTNLIWWQGVKERLY